MLVRGVGCPALRQWRRWRIAGVAGFSALLWKTVGLADVLVEALADGAGRVDVAFLFGLPRGIAQTQPRNQRARPE